MSHDDATKERIFLTSLKGDTGRDVGEWMSAINSSGHTERNDIIDWLRSEGFPFAKASWLERIHHNHGQPIYMNDSASPEPQPASNAANARTTSPKSSAIVPPSPITAQSPAPDSTNQKETELRKSEVVTAIPHASRPTPIALPTPDPDALEKTLQTGKAYRPLAQFLLKEITQVLPSATYHPASSTITISNPAPFAVVGVSSKGLRFALALDGEPTIDLFTAAKFPNSTLRVSAQISHCLTHLAILTDARQVNDVLMEHITRSCRHVNGA